MPLTLTHIRYADLNGRQQENFNYQKVSAVLADYGFVTLRLSDDWQGADFIAQHVDGETFVKVQLKGRLTFSKKYIGKGLYVAFHTKGDWFLYPHDDLLKVVLAVTGIGKTRSWKKKRGGYSFPRLSRQLRELLTPYKIAGSVRPVE
jgi:hypothetical protein